MNVLVTGGAGFLGSHLVDALVAAGHQVSVLDNLRRGSLANIERAIASRDLRFIEADIRDYTAVRQAFTHIELVYHLAAQANVMGAVEDPNYARDTNVTGTYNVLKAAASAGVRRLVFSSSREVYGDPDSIPVPESAVLQAKNLYGASKVAGEAYCRVWQATMSLECQVLRFANIYGPRDRDRVIPTWLERASRGERLQIYGGEQLIDFVWVGTAVQAALQAGTCKLIGPVNVGSGTGVSLHYLARRIMDETRSASKLEILPPRPAEVVRFVADVGRMQRNLGVSPEMTPLQRLDRCLPNSSIGIQSTVSLLL